MRGTTVLYKAARVSALLDCSGPSESEGNVPLRFGHGQNRKPVSVTVEEVPFRTPALLHAVGRLPGQTKAAPPVSRPSA
jgi:hypothetical protein